MMGRVMDRLRRLDDRAFNSWWGLFVTPFAWIWYRLGRRYGAESRLGEWVGGAPGAIYARGAREGRPLRR